MDTVVERLVGAYRVHRAAEVLGWCPLHRARGPARVISQGGRLAAVGRSGIVNQPTGGGGGTLPDWVERLHNALMTFPERDRYLLVRFARAGGLPPWFPGAVEIAVPVTKPDGRVVRRYDQHRNWIGIETRAAVYWLHEGQACEWAGGTMAEVWQARWRYVAWHVAATKLALLLAVPGPEGDPQPWLADSAIEAVVRLALVSASGGLPGLERPARLAPKKAG